MYDSFACIGSKRSLKRTRCSYVIWVRYTMLGQLSLPKMPAGEFRAERIAQPVKGTATTPQPKTSDRRARERRCCDPLWPL
jgi:hypothetical protein